MPNIRAFLIRRWRFIAALICGSMIAAVMFRFWDLHPQKDPGWISQLPIMPGFILIPVYFATGGVHSDWFSVALYSLIPLNGAGYVFIGIVIQRVNRSLRPRP